MNIKTLWLYKLVVLFSIISCNTGENEFSNSKALVVKSKDLTNSINAQLILIDSLTLRLPEQEKIFDGRAYVFDKEVLFLHKAEREILRFDSNGRLLTRMGGAGKGPGEFTDLITLTMDSQFIYGLGENPLLLNIYNHSGEFISSYKWNLGDNFNNIFSEFGNLVVTDQKLLSPVDACCHSSATMEFYEAPFIGVCNLKGELIKMFGHRDSIYTHSKVLDHVKRVFFNYDINSKNIITSQQAAHLLDVYNTDGIMLKRFGIKAKHMNNTNFIYKEDVNFDDSSDEIFDFGTKLRYETSMYYEVFISENYIVRFYRNGISMDKKPRFIWEKPLYYQIYNRDGDLITDRKAPKNWFFPRGVSEDNHFWFSYEDSYWNTPPNSDRPDKFHHTIYKYHVQVKEK